MTVNLTDAKGKFRVEWVHPIEGTSQESGIVDGGSKRTLKAPFPGDAVLLLTAVRS